MTIRRILFCAAILLLCLNSASAARYQRCKDGKTLVWNSSRGVAQDANWSGLRDLNGYATGEGTLTWYRLGAFVNSYTGKMVRGKFEGPVVRQQGSTRLQANFTNGEKMSGWSEPGSRQAPVETPPPNEPNEQTENAEELPTESPSPSAARIPSPTPTAAELPSPTPTPTPTPRPTPSPTPTPRSSPTPTPTPTATLKPSPSPTSTVGLISPTPTPTPRVTSMSTPMGMPALMPTATPTPLRSFSPSPAESPENATSPAAPSAETPMNTLELGRSPEPQGTSERGLASSATAVPKTTPGFERPSTSQKIDPNVKRQLIAQFRKEIDSVLGQVRNATNGFREVDRLEQVRSLPSAVSSHVTLLTGSAREFRGTLGYEVAFYECLAEMQTVDALLVVDQVTSIIAAKDTPVARKTLSAFRDRYPKPSTEAQKPLWRYIDSMYALCDRLKTEAEGHLQRARSLETEGKKADALREYREINRIYPNKITEERIHLLEAPPR